MYCGFAQETMTDLHDSDGEAIGNGRDRPVEVFPKGAHLEEECFCVHCRGGELGLVCHLDHLEGGLGK